MSRLKEVEEKIKSFNNAINEIDKAGIELQDEDIRSINLAAIMVGHTLSDTKESEV